MICLYNLTPYLYILSYVLYGKLALECLLKALGKQFYKQFCALKQDGEIRRGSGFRLKFGHLICNFHKLGIHYKSDGFV